VEGCVAIHVKVNSNSNRYPGPVKICCSVLQCVAVCCSVLQRVMNGIMGQTECTNGSCQRYDLENAGLCNVLQCVAVCCSELQCVAGCDCSLNGTLLSLLRFAVCCSVLQCVTV